MRTILTTIFLLLATLSCKAQTEPEYRAEIGGGVGLATYQGDLNGSILRNMQPVGVLLARYRFNPRMGLALNVGYGKLKGDTKKVDTWYPDHQEQVYAFDNTLVDAGIRFEVNFWPYGTGREYFGAKPLTPYLAIGLGMTYVKGDKSIFAGNLPIGVGVKYKLSQRLNVGMEWAIHFSTTDRLDGVDDPYRVTSHGMFKNTDCYSMLRLSLTYDIAAKCKTCNNDSY